MKSVMSRASSWVMVNFYVPVPQKCSLKKNLDPYTTSFALILKNMISKRNFLSTMAILGVIFGLGGIIIDRQRDTFLKNFYELVPRIHLHPSSWRMHPEKMSESKAFVFFCWTLNILGRLIWELPMMALFWGKLLADQKCCLYGGELPRVLAPLAGFEAFVLQKKISNRHSSHTKTAKMSDQSKKTIQFFRNFDMSSPHKTPSLFHPEKQPEPKKT